jgi:hypothetical protein
MSRKVYIILNMRYKNFHFYSSGPNKDKNTMNTMGINSDSMFDYINLP